MKKLKLGLATVLSMALLVPSLSQGVSAQTPDQFTMEMPKEGISDGATLPEKAWTPEEEKFVDEYMKKYDDLIKTDKDAATLKIVNRTIKNVCTADDSGSTCEKKIKIELDTLGIPPSIPNPANKNQKKSLNYTLYAAKGWIVYGTHQDVDKFIDTNTWKPKPKGSFKNDKGVPGEWRYVGLNMFGMPYPNVDFPPDSLVTTDMSTRKWISQPWQHTDEIENNSFIPFKTPWMDANESVKWTVESYSKTNEIVQCTAYNDDHTPKFDNNGDIAQTNCSVGKKKLLIRDWLGWVMDTYKYNSEHPWGFQGLRGQNNSLGNPYAGNFAKPNAKIGGKELIKNINGMANGSNMQDYAIINMPPTPYSPGHVTLMHRVYDNSYPLMYDYTTEKPNKPGSGKKARFHDWYDSFIIPPTAPDLGKVFDDISITGVKADKGKRTGAGVVVAAPGTAVALTADLRAISPGQKELPQYTTLKKNGLMEYSFAAVARAGKIPAVWVMYDETNKVFLDWGKTELTANGQATESITSTRAITFPSITGKSMKVSISVYPMGWDMGEGAAPINEWDWDNNVQHFTLMAGPGDACNCSFTSAKTKLPYVKNAATYSFDVKVGGQVSPAINPDDVQDWSISLKNTTTGDVYANNNKMGVSFSSFTADAKLNLPASDFFFDKDGNGSVNVSLQVKTLLKNGTSVTHAVPCHLTLTVFGGPPNNVVVGPNPPPGNPVIAGAGLDNLKITKLIPVNGNGALKPSDPVKYVAVVKSELPTSYATITFNGGTKSEPIPLYPDVVKALSDINALPNASASASGTITAPETITVTKYVSKTCGGYWHYKQNADSDWVEDDYVSTYECGRNQEFIKTNPDYDTAQTAAAAIAAKYPNVQSTVYIQGETCNVTVYRGGDEQYCEVTGIMPDPRNDNNEATDNTRVDVVARVVGTGVKETSAADNEAKYTMYPILPTPTAVSTSKLEAYNVDPKDPSKRTLNSKDNPAKFGQRISLKAISSAGIKADAKLYGYSLMRLYSELATTSYNENIPVQSTFNVRGDTPSEQFNGVSTFAGNKTWQDSPGDPTNNDFDNARSVRDDGKGKIDDKFIKNGYLHKVTREDKSYTIPGKTFNWKHYETFYANYNSLNAKVAVEWQTKPQNAWIIDLVKTKTSPIGFWPEHSTLPPLKNGVPTPISKGGEPQKINMEVEYGQGAEVGTVTVPIYMFGSVSSTISTGN